MSAGQRVPAPKLLADHAAQMAEQDIKIAEHLAGFVAVHRASTYPSRAFAALVGHPRVRLADGEQHVAVKRFPLGFTALPVGEQIRVEPAVDGARFSPRLLVPLMQAFVQGEPGTQAVIYEMLSASRHSEEIRAEMAELYRTWRHHLADALRHKQ
jgi:hypothetical protein